MGVVTKGTGDCGGGMKSVATSNGPNMGFGKKDFGSTVAADVDRESERFWFWL